MNIGFPLRVGTVIDRQVIKVLEDAGVQRDIELPPGTAMNQPKPNATSISGNANPANVPLGVPYIPKDYPKDIASRMQSLPKCRHALEAGRCDLVNKPYPRSWVGLMNKVKCIHIDTMANGTFLKQDMKDCMVNPKRSHHRIRVANKQFCLWPPPLPGNG